MAAGDSAAITGDHRVNTSGQDILLARGGALRSTVASAMMPPIVKTMMLAALYFLMMASTSACPMNEPTRPTAE